MSCFVVLPSVDIKKILLLEVNLQDILTSVFNIKIFTNNYSYSWREKGISTDEMKIHFVLSVQLYLMF